MKLIAILLFATCLQISAKTLGQSITLNEKNTSLKKIFKEIKKQTGAVFFYDEVLLKKSSPVNISVQNVSLSEVLTQIFESQVLTYEIIGANIITVKEKSAVIVVLPVPPPPFVITGKVVDASGKFMPGVSVVIKSSKKGISTDAEGNFSIEMPQDGDILVFSYVGFENVELKVTKPGSINIILKQKENRTEEIVVVGYGTQKKIDLTGAITSVKMNDVIKDRPVSSAVDALQGVVPNLQITSGSGIPGTVPDLSLRGFQSINGGSPLVLVDNVPMSMNDINPRDIETITVLKDAAASSIYGGRAAFGVILISTKQEKRNQPIRFNYSTNLTVGSPSNLPVKASIAQSIKAFKDFGNTQMWTGQDLNTWQKLLDNYNKDPSAYPGGQAVVNGVIYGLRENDLYHKFMQNSFQQMHNLSFSGGSQKSSYRVSMGYDNEDGVMVTNKDSYRKYNFNALLNTDVTKNITTTINVFYKNDNQLTPSEYTTLFYNAIGFPSWSNTGFHTLTNGNILPFDSPNNILATEPPNEIFGDDIRLLGKVEAKPFRSFTITGEYTFDKSTNNSRFFSAKNLYENSQTYNEQYLNNTSKYYRSNDHTNYSALNLYASYSKDINDHNFKILVGTNQESSKYEIFTAQKLDILSSDVPSLSTGTGTMTNSDAFQEYAISGYFGRFNYNYKDKYLFEANSRYDGSSRFPPTRKFGFFPSFSAGWVISKEGFIRPLDKVIQNLKIRVSWGEIGNQVVGNNYPYIPGLPTYNAAWVDPTTNIRVLSLQPPSLVSSDFSWETVRTSNLGLDFSLFKGKLNSSFDVYKRQTLNMLAQGSQLPAVLGASAPLQNAANLEVKGWELSMSWKDRAGGFNYSFGFNLSDNRAHITKFDNAGGLLSQYYVGQQIGDIWGYQTDGFFTVNDFVAGSLDNNLQHGTLKNSKIAAYKGESPNPGDIRYVDLNGDGVIYSGNNTLTNPGDTKIIGNNNRRYQYGIFGNLSWKKINLSFLIQGVAKRDLWISNELYWPYQDIFESLYTHQLNYWTPDNTNAFYPRSYANASGNSDISRLVQTKYLSNGAYIRLKNIQIGYSLPRIAVSKIDQVYVRIFFSGENLITWDHLPKGIDPEIVNVNRGGGYPFISKYSFGLNISF